MSTSDRRRSSRDGFALVEALAAMAISGFLLLALASVISLMLRTSQRVDRDAQDFEATSRTVDAITRDLAWLKPIRWAGQDAGFVFYGSPTIVMFAEVKNLEASPRVVRLEDAPAKPAAALLRSSAPLLPEATGADDVSFDTPVVMYSGDYAIRFAYYDRIDTGQERLVDNWDRLDRLPVAIRVALIGQTTGRARISVRVPIMMTAEAGCAAPGRGACSFITRNENGFAVDSEGRIVDDTPIDANEDSGWQRFLTP